MLKNYILTTYKNLLKQKVFALINISGLGIGLCVFLLVSLYVQKELSYEKQWENSERILQLNMLLRPESLDPVVDNLTSYLVMPPLQQYFSNEIEFSARRVIRGNAVHVGEEIFPGGLSLYEREFIDIFKFDVISGSLEETLENPNRIALSVESALTYFGTDNVLGRTLSLEIPNVGLLDYTVTSLYRMPVGNTKMDFPSIALFDESAMTEREEALNSWGPGGWFVMNYFLLKPNAKIEGMNLQMDDFMKLHVGASPYADNFILRFQKLTDIYFSPNRRAQGGDKFQLTIFSVIAILVLLVGSVNFVILTTANSINRRHEVGVRKVAGAKKSQLIFQFLGESILFTVIALILAVVLAELTLPFFSRLIGDELAFDYLRFSNWIFLTIVVFVLGGLGGLYPALILANLKPACMLKGRGFGDMPGHVAGSISIKNLLVGFQFTISIFLLIATLVLYAQLSFYQSHNRGFNPENLIAIDAPNTSPENGERLRGVFMEEIKKLPGVEKVTLSMNQPNDSLRRLPSIPLSSATMGGSEVFSMGLFVAYDFFEVYQIPLLAGRTYDDRFDVPVIGSSSIQRKIVVNRFAATALGFPTPESAVGQEISYGLIIGVVENSQILSTLQDVNVEIYPLVPSFTDVITIRFQELSETTIVENLESVWNDVISNEEFRFNFISQRLQSTFIEEEGEGKLLLTLSLLSIFVSCLGLYGLVAFSVRRQTKEIGVRKVLGADFNAILKLFLWLFIQPVIVANIIAWPLALWVMLSWLQRFPYQINTMLIFPLCLASGIIALLIAFITVSGTVAKFANKNPVLALRYE